MACTSTEKFLTNHDTKSIHLTYDDLPDVAHIQIALGRSFFKEPGPFAEGTDSPIPAPDSAFWDITTAFPDTTANQLPLRFGADSNGESRFNGDIGLVQIHNIALTEDEIASLAAGTLTDTDNLVGYWAFDNEKEGTFSRRS